MANRPVNLYETVIDRATKAADAGRTQCFLSGIGSPYTRKDIEETAMMLRREGFKVKEYTKEIGRGHRILHHGSIRVSWDEDSSP